MNTKHRPAGSKMVRAAEKGTIAICNPNKGSVSRAIAETARDQNQTEMKRRQDKRKQRLTAYD